MLDRLSPGVFMGMALLAVAGTGFAAISKPVDSHVAFAAAGPGGLKIEGTTTELDVSEGADKIVITVPLGALQTGIALRDRHLKEKYLEVARYPKSELAIERSALKLPATGTLASDVPGVLTLHGKSNPVTVHYEASKNGSAISVTGTFHLNITQFGITVPSYLGVTVKPDVDVHASFRVTE